MAINRGYKPAEQVIMDDWYNPSMEMLAQVGAMAQKQQDTYAAQLAKLGETQFNFLQKDYEKASGTYKDIYENINKLSQGAMGDGDLRSVRAEIDRYGRELSRRASPYGDIGAMESNYKQYTDWAKTVDEKAAKEFGKDGITSAHAQALKNYVLSQYQGIGEQDKQKGYNRISLANPANAVDITKITEELGKGYVADSYKDAEIDPQTGQIKQGAMWRDQGRIWRKTGTSKEEVKANDVFTDLIYGITKNEGYGQYLNQLKQLGLSEYGMGDMYVDKVDETTGETKKVLNDNHPIVQEAKRGASKFGFQKLEFSDDIKFDEWDLKTYESDLRIKEENNKKQMLVLESASKERTFSYSDLNLSVRTLQNSKKTNEQLVTNLKGQLDVAKSKGNADEIKATQIKLNNALQQQNTLKVQESNAKAKLARIEKAANIDVNAEATALGVSSEEYLAIMRGEKSPPTTKRQKPGSVKGQPVFENIVDPRYKTAMSKYEQGIKKGEGEVAKFTEQRSFIVPSANTRIAEKIDLVKKKIMNGAGNFISEDGIDFNNQEFSDLIANGSLDLQLLTNPVNGKPGWEIVITEKGKNSEKAKGFKNIVGNIEGLSNSTIIPDLVVEIEEMAKAKGIATPQAQQLMEVSRMFIGSNAIASSNDGTATGAGSVHDQVLSSDVNLLKEGEESNYIYLPHGTAVKFEAIGDGTYLPKMYNVTQTGAGTGYQRIADADVGLTGSMSVEDFYSWLGQSSKLHPGVVGPNYVVKP
jgi:hypothetical protein